MHVSGQTEGGLRAALRHVRAVAADETRVLIGDNGPGIGRVFMACGCGRLRPIYRIADKSELYCPTCGGSKLYPTRISEWRAAWWVLGMGWLWRRTIRRKREQRLWDPRLPLRLSDPSY